MGQPRPHPKEVGPNQPSQIFVPPTCALAVLETAAKCCKVMKQDEGERKVSFYMEDHASLSYDTKDNARSVYAS